MFLNYWIHVKHFNFKPTTNAISSSLDPTALLYYVFYIVYKPVFTQTVTLGLPQLRILTIFNMHGLRLRLDLSQNTNASAMDSYISSQNSNESIRRITRDRQSLTLLRTSTENKRRLKRKLQVKLRQKKTGKMRQATLNVNTKGCSTLFSCLNVNMSNETTGR